MVIVVIILAAGWFLCALALCAGLLKASSKQPPRRDLAEAAARLEKVPGCELGSLENPRWSWRTVRPVDVSINLDSREKTSKPFHAS